MTTSPLTTAAQLAPLIERVHGPNHPELTRVRELTEQLTAAGPDDDIRALFGELRAVTNGYTVPDDGCEAFQDTYAALELADAETAGQS